MNSFYLVYDEKDQDVANQIRRNLAEWDINIRSIIDTPVGTNTLEQIRKEIKRTKFILVLVSKNYIRFQRLRDRIEDFAGRESIAREEKCIPVLIENVEMPYELIGINPVNLVGGYEDVDNEEYKKLSKLIRERVSGNLITQITESRISIFIAALTLITAIMAILVDNGMIFRDDPPGKKPIDENTTKPRAKIPPYTPTETPTEENLSQITELEEFLKAGKWREANDKTSTILLRYSNAKTHLDTGAYSEPRIPQDVYLEIDRLWREYSGGQFGMSVQNNIWEKLNNKLQNSGINCSDGNPETWEKCAKEFAKQVGHLDPNGNYLQIGGLNYNKNAPKGHLPVTGLPSSSTYHLAGRIKNQLALDNKYR